MHTLSQTEITSEASAVVVFRVHKFIVLHHFACIQNSHVFITGYIHKIKKIQRRDKKKELRMQHVMASKQVICWLGPLPKTLYICIYTRISDRITLSLNYALTCFVYMPSHIMMIPYYYHGTKSSSVISEKSSRTKLFKTTS